MVMCMTVMIGLLWSLLVVFSCQLLATVATMVLLMLKSSKSTMWVRLAIIGQPLMTLLLLLGV